MRKLWILLPLVALIAAGCGKGKNTGAAGKGDKGKPVAANSKPGADQMYTIKLKVFPDVNKTVTVRETAKTTGTTKMTTGNQGKDGQENGNKEIVYTMTVLEAGDKMPKKFKRTYEKAIESKNGPEKTKSYQGKTVIFTLSGEHYQTAAEGGKIDPADMAQLAKDADDNVGRHELALLPSKPVKVGESWDFDPSKMGPKELARGADMAASKGKAKLEKVYTKDGKQYATIGFHLLLVVKEMPGLKLDKPAKLSLIGKVDAPIDGSSTARKMTGKGTMEMKGSVEQGGKKVMEMDSTIKADLTEEVSAEK